MKKKLAIAAGTIVAAGVLVIGFFHASASQVDPSLTADEVRKLVSKQYPGKINKPVLKTEANRAVYEVKASTNDKTYDLKIDGHSGEILNIQATKNTAQYKQDHKEENQEEKNKARKEDKEDKENKANIGEQNDQATKQKENKTVISPEEAAQIAQQQSSGEVDDIDLEEEDGRLIYEVEIERGEQEAKIEIDAYTGEVIVIEIEED